MSIVLDEKKWAEEAIKERSLGKKPTETLGRIAKYYLYCGKSKKDTRHLIESFLLSCDSMISAVSWSDRLDSIVRYALKHPLVMIDKIDITVSEMERIESLDSSQLQRLAFSLLCIAKYNHRINQENEYWVNTPDSEIMRMSNINTSIKRQSLLFSKLKDAGLIRFSNKVDNLSVQVLFANDNSDVAISVIDYRNLGYQYLKYHGGNYLVCQNCGITFKCSSNTGRKRDYCDDCAIKIKTKQNVDSVMRLRQKVKN